MTLVRYKHRIVKPGIYIDNSGNTSSGSGIDSPTDGIESLETGNDIQPDGKAVGNTVIESRYCGNDFPDCGNESLNCGIDFLSVVIDFLSVVIDFQRVVIDIKTCGIDSGNPALSFAAR